MHMTYDSKEAGILLIDGEYRIVYCNDTAKEMFPSIQIGELCYQTLYDENMPCGDCPPGTEDRVSLIYSKEAGCWLEVSVGRMELPIRNAADLQMVMCFVRDGERQIQNPEEKGDPEEDPLTGLYRRGRFLAAARQLLKGIGKARFCLMAVDIEHFKLFNDWYGQEAGDRFLIDIGRCLKEAVRRAKGVAGYMGNDDFAILLPDDSALLTGLQNQIMGCVKQYGGQAGFLPAFGLYAIENPGDSVRKMYDRACMALDSVKGNYIRRMNWYDAGMMTHLEESHKLLSQIRRALERGEFVFYVQPMCNMATGKIVGLESLVRWKHPERGLICPGEFVPMLERNGLISALDQYVWEKVCASVRRWIDAGHRAVPVSVNMSRADLFTLDVAACFTNLTAKYGLEPRLIQIEITESAYAEDFQVISNVVEKLRNAGFTVLMDDFGSGYSSLNMLKDIRLDLLKMDMKFLDMDTQSAGKGIEIVEAITSMAHLMGLRVIAEGVETREQMKFLLDIGCLYGQGYYFYRPMPIEELESLLADEENIDFGGIQPTAAEVLKLRELLNGDWISEAVVNNILGGAAVYGVRDGHVELLRTNRQYCRITRTAAVDPETHRQTFIENVYQEDRERFLAVFEQAREDVINGAQVEARRVLPDGQSIWIRLRVFFLREKDGCGLFYGSISDVTDQKHREQQLENSQRALTAVVHLSENDESFMGLTEENRRLAASIFAQMTPGGMIGGYCEDGFPLYFANHEMVKLLGYETYDEFAEAIRYKVANTIHPDDRSRVLQDLGAEYYAGMEYTTTYRMPKKDGSWFWTLDKGRVIQAEDGRLAIVSACTDISETMMVQEKLAERNALLLRQNQELTFLNRDMPGGYHRCSDTPGFPFIYISDRFLSIFGYTREEIRRLFNNEFLNMVHPEDRRLIEEGTAEIRDGSAVSNLEYRMLSKHGYIWVVDQSRYMYYANNRFFQGVIIDITETVTLRNKLQMLLRNMPEDIILVTAEDGTYRCEAMSNGLSRERGIDLATYQRSLDTAAYEHYMEEGELARVKRKIDKAMSERDGCQDVVQFTEPDGSRLWASLDARYIHDRPEGITYLFLLGDVTDFKEQESELRLAGEQTESILRQAGINSWEWEIPHDRLILRNAIPNPALAEKYPGMGKAYTEVAHFTSEIWKIFSVPAEYRAVIEKSLEKVRNGVNRNHFQYEVPVRTAGDETIWLHIACEILRDEKNRPVKAVGYYTDVTDRKIQTFQSREDQKTLELLRKQALYDFMVNLTRNMVVTGGSLHRWARETGGQESPVYTDMTSYLADHLILPEFRERFLAFSDRARMLGRSRGSKATESFEYRRLVNKSPRWMHMIVHYIRFEDSPDTYIYIFIVDIDQQKRQELELTRLAQTDEMTGLYNRRAAIHIIQQRLTETEGRKAAFIILDLDNFKLANDMFGHVFGDTVLAEIARKLKNCFGPEDVVCRLGGDEFLVFCQNISQEAVECRLGKIIEEVFLRKSDGKQAVLFTLSAGYAMAPEQGCGFDELYRKADMALFAAKEDGKRQFRKYGPHMKAVRDGKSGER